MKTKNPVPAQPATPTLKPRLCFDADVLFAGSASPNEHSASLVLLRMAEITLIEAIVSQQVIDECERNLSDKLPAALPAFRMLVSRCARVVPAPTKENLVPFSGLANPQDLPILVTAIQYNCTWLVTFNVRHYQPGHPKIVVSRPGELVLRIRELLTKLPERAEE